MIQAKKLSALVLGMMGIFGQEWRGLTHGLQSMVIV
jgi:hypothetical protein